MSKLHLVFGGRVKDPQGLEFVDLNAIDFVGLFESYAGFQTAKRLYVVVGPVFRGDVGGHRNDNVIPRREEG